MSSGIPAWTLGAKHRAKHEGLALVKVYIQGKHIGHGTYGISMAMRHEDALLLAAVCNIISQGRKIPEEAYNALGLDAPRE